MTAREMKDSGVEWIGTIPACWEVHRIKTNFDIIGGNGFSPSLQGQETGDLPVCKASDISNAGAKLSKAENFITFSEAKLYSFNLIPKGSVLFAKIGEAMKKNNRTLTLVECCADNNCQAMVPKKIDSQFSYYLFNCIDMTWFDNAGTVPCISNQKLKNSKIPYPSIFEQKRIAKYLNNKCAEIDSLTADIEKQIETLQEYKKSVITEAVTKGLDPNVEMKDSGVEWIGSIPLTWTTSKLLYQLSRPITDGPHETPELLDEGIPFISAEAVSEGFINFEKPRGYISEDYYRLCCKKYTPQLHDVYIVKSGATTGVSAIVEDDRIFQIWSPLAAIRADQSKLIPTFLLYVVKSHYFLKQVENFWSFGTQQNIGMRVLEKLKVAIPPIEEQIGIASFLKGKCSEINGAINEKQKQLETLAQYKKSLIYEYVTGKKTVPM